MLHFQPKPVFGNGFDRQTPRTSHVEPEPDGGTNTQIRWIREVGRLVSPAQRTRSVVSEVGTVSGRQTSDPRARLTGPDSASEPFRFQYTPGTIRYGDGAVSELGFELAERNLGRALVVTGRTVGDSAAVMDPVQAGLRDRCAGVFAETTPEKRLGTAVAGAKAMRAHDAEAIVAVGGGSSLDTAKAVAVLAGSDDDAQSFADEFSETGTISVPDEVPPILAVPTTLAGADHSHGAGLSADPESGLVDESVSGGFGHPSLLPKGVVYDPALFATTPREVLRSSAMNGFDKGLETLYSCNGTAITDATAMRGIQRFHDGLLTVADGNWNDEAGLAAVVEGLALVQYGVSRPDAGTLSVIHAVCHGVRNAGSVSQGVAHAVMAPHVLRYLFDRVDGRRHLIAEALGVPEATDPAEEVVEAVTELRDALDLPARLRDVDGPEPDEFDAVASAVMANPLLSNAPDGLDPSADELASVFEAAW